MLLRWTRRLRLNFLAVWHVFASSWACCLCEGTLIPELSDMGHLPLRPPPRGGQRSEFQRLVLNLSSGSVRRQAASHRCCEFSAMNMAYTGKPYRHAYVPASRIEDPFYWGPNQVLLWPLVVW